MKTEKVLRAWLRFVAVLRLVSFATGYLAPEVLHSQVAALANEDSSPLHARVFAVWTLLSGACAWFCAGSLRSRPIVQLALVSFYIAAAFFATEYAFFATVTAANLIPIAFVAGTSIVALHAHLAALSPPVDYKVRVRSIGAIDLPDIAHSTNYVRAFIIILQEA
jgi:hypothetical protein